MSTAESDTVKTDDYCKGRICDVCGKCKDWLFTGDKATLDWIRSWESNWQEEDWDRYNNENIHGLFKKRDGGTCRYDPHPAAQIYHGTAFDTTYSVYSFGGEGPGGHLPCLCEKS